MNKRITVVMYCGNRMVAELLSGLSVVNPLDLTSYQAFLHLYSTYITRRYSEKRIIRCESSKKVQSSAFRLFRWCSAFRLSKRRRTLIPS